MKIQKVSKKHILSGTLLISGTAVGAGMLGIPLLTVNAGFLPAVLITALVWIFMVATGFLFLEVTLWMEEGANILSMAKRFLGLKGKITAGLIYAFLYYSLLIAYFAAGAPIFAAFLEAIFGIVLSGWVSNFLFGLVFGAIVAFGIKWVDRFNYLLIFGMVISYIGLLSVGSSEIVWERLDIMQWRNAPLALPVLFSAFGYHNVIPSLTTYFNRNAKVMRHAIFWGTLIPLIVYILWQWLIIGAVPKELVVEALQEGRPVTETMQALTGNAMFGFLGRAFGLFAIVTSLLGVSFSMVDFLGDGFKMERKGRDRFLLCILTFGPPFFLSTVDPTIFVTAIGVAGGFGEALLNGMLPIAMVWMGRYQMQKGSQYQIPGQKFSLGLLFGFSLLVILLEFLVLFQGSSI